MTAYYNEIDPYAAAWLRNLIAVGHIALGDVDERSIEEVSADDLKGYDQCHFFAGIGGWSYALRLAGWPDDRPVWTGSCPCQPFSLAGKRHGTNDPRHLWPAWFGLIRERRPYCLFGEQVPGAIGQGWLDGICRDLEGENYAVGSLVLGAHSVGAPHIRQRLFWVADAGGERGQQDAGSASRHERSHGRWSAGDHVASGDGEDGGLGVSHCTRWFPRFPSTEAARYGSAPEPTGGIGRMVDAKREQMGQTGQPWECTTCIPCGDGKARCIEPGTFPLAHGVPNRVGRLRAYGNAIVPVLAARFIEGYLAI